MIFQYTGTDTVKPVSLTNNNTGNIAFFADSYYQEETPDVTHATSHLKFLFNGNSIVDMGINKKTGNVGLKGRFFSKAVFPSTGLQLKYDKEVVTQMNEDGNFYVKGEVTTSVSNPGNNGPFNFNSIVYAKAGLSYTNPALDTQYVSFETPTLNYITRTIDLSDFVVALSYQTGYLSSPLWPFNQTTVPINGILRLPNNTPIGQKLPLVLFAHGNHDPVYLPAVPPSVIPDGGNSTPGYIYLCELLASHGIIAGTIDVNFLNGDLYGENGARAIVHLEHVKQFKIWNEKPGHPLEGKIDMDNIMIVGHSRGGEAVGHACYFNTLDVVSPTILSPPVKINGTVHDLGPYHFNIKCATAFAPTDGQYEPVINSEYYSLRKAEPTKIVTNYLILHGSFDCDVNSFPGYITYDRAFPIDFKSPTTPAKGFKSLLWIYKANHNYFNSVWAQDCKPPAPATITRLNQEKIAKVYISAFAQAMLLNRSQYLDLLKSYRVGTTKNWVDTSITYVSQYQDKKRLFIQDFEKIGPIAISEPLTGTVDTTNVTADQLWFNCLDGDEKRLYQATGGLKLEWDNNTKSYKTTIDNIGTCAPETYQFFALRVGQSNEAKNLINANQNFTIKISDSSNTYSGEPSTFSVLPYPSEVADVSYERKTVMQTIRIPMQNIKNANVDLTKIKTIEFVFNKINNGILYFDDIQLSD